MSDRRNHIRYLNRFLHQVWPSAADILGPEITHMAMVEADDSLPKIARISRAQTRIDLSDEPRFFADGPDGLELRIPASGENGFRTRVYLLPLLPRPRINVDVGLSITLGISPDAGPTVNSEVDVGGNVTGDIVDHWADWEDDIRSQFEGHDLKSELGFFSAARYDGASVPDIPDPVRHYPRRAPLDGAVDLVFVPDGFPPDDMAAFDRIVDAAVERLTTPADDRANEPFFSFKTVTNVWSVKPDQTPDGDHVVASYTDPRGKHRVALGNLARLAAIGHAAEALGTGPTILIFLADHRAPRFGGAPPLAMALGPVILQPTRQGGDADDPPHSGDVSVLLHELGHTILARLGDEYDMGRDETYLGQPLAAPNLTADSGLKKFRRWIDAPSELPDWDQQPVIGAEGGGYFTRGIWRPAEDCAMRRSSAGLAFCAVCREALTNGFARVLPQGRFLFRVDYPSGDPVMIEVDAEDDGTAASEQIVIDAGGSVPLTVELVAATLPEPWLLSARLRGDGDLRTIRDHRVLDGGPTPPRTRWRFTADPGDRLTVDVRSRCPFTPWDPMPDYRIGLHCVPDRESVEPPSTPSDVSVRQVSVNPEGTRQRIRISARTADPNGQDVRFSAQITRRDQSFRGTQARSDWTALTTGGEAQADFSHALSLSGGYKLRVRAENRSGRKSGWSDTEFFTIRAQTGGGKGGGTGGGHGGGGHGGGTGGGHDGGDIHIP